DWQVQHAGDKPFVREENLALTPMVVVMWAERYESFAKKYGEVSFKTLSQALTETGGWQTIAGKSEWGLFKLGHTHPNESNSGIATLALMAYDYHGKTRDLSLKDILDPGFQSWAQGFEKGVRPFEQHRQPDAGDGAQRSLGLRRRGGLRERGHRLPQECRGALGRAPRRLSEAESLE
ncbi:MAG TPA: hypothetical protein VLV54_20635, partial [Thermoanaerobaculia bacterium]|nr:hypothetical protein [Thermoanaerobaculia bacterium]